uniref:G-protein coupled receptors family 1 profile domain-containing protein n=1 Tax=Laticauda laticaudata TaxID=8630 RepID=A0A8C5SYD9_LATLA
MEKLNHGQLNITKVTEFILLGFPGNLSIILLIITHQHVHIPMYIFLCNLAFLEIWLITASIPKIPGILLGGSRSISFSCCLLQLYFIFSFGCTEQLLLAVMAYDRYLSPCHTAQRMQKGHSRRAKCSIRCYPLLKRGKNLHTANTHFIELTFLFMAIIAVTGSCMMTLLSYMYIISTILCIPSTKGRQKTFFICSSHLAVVIIWYGSTMFLFVKPSKEMSLEKNKLVSVFSVILVPLLIPFIYTLRYKDIRDILKNRLFSRLRESKNP